MQLSTLGQWEMRRGWVNSGRLHESGESSPGLGGQNLVRYFVWTDRMRGHSKLGLQQDQNTWTGRATICLGTDWRRGPMLAALRSKKPSKWRPSVEGHKGQVKECAFCMVGCRASHNF